MSYCTVYVQVKRRPVILATNIDRRGQVQGLLHETVRKALGIPNIMLGTLN